MRSREYLRAADIGLSFIKPSYSKLASSPTKIAEYLASGLPIICNAGIGDLDVLIEGDRVGVLVRELNAGHYENALRRVDGLLREGQVSSRCPRECSQPLRPREHRRRAVLPPLPPAPGIARTCPRRSG